MVYKCDVCATEDAAIFCFAESAVMCRGCDARAHGANKLAKKHERVSLQPETEAATCDICQEHKAIIFCPKDRALLCRRCDLMIHTANEYVAKHDRYLLSGATVGLKALEGSISDDADDEKLRKPYGLRNTIGAQKEKEPWQTNPAPERASWRSAATVRAPETSAAALGTVDEFGSQPALINVRNPARDSSNPRLGDLPNATSLVTPFGRQEEQFTDASPSDSPPVGAGDASSSAPVFNGWGDVLNDGVQPNSSDFTLAAELLGMPSVSHGFSAKDIDAAYIFDDNCDLDTNLSALLEVPELSGAFQLDDPTLVNHAAVKSGPMVANLGEKRGSPTDGVVPDFHMEQPVMKKPRT